MSINSPSLTQEEPLCPGSLRDSKTFKQQQTRNSASGQKGRQSNNAAVLSLDLGKMIHNDYMEEEKDDGETPS